MADTGIELPRVVTREEWLGDRKKLLEKEKAAVRARDALNAERRRLPRVEITKEYAFAGPSGAAQLADLFDGRTQLVVYHFMWLHDEHQGCPSCSFLVDGIGPLAHLHARDTSLVLVSRGPIAEIAAFERRMGWDIPWYSSLGSDFNYDFHVTSDPAVAPVEYNYRTEAELAERGHTYHLRGEQPGVSVFLRDAGRVYHTYSTYGRGMDILDGTYNYLDLTLLGRQEGWGGTRDLRGEGLFWNRHHDRYEAKQRGGCCAHRGAK
jgi:predicted dithiol-disulfide oxidoreductase (DUF899 family)